MRALLLLIAVLIGYGSLYPFHFAADPHWPQEAAALLTAPLWPMGRGDLVGNVLLFAPYGLVAALLCAPQRRGYSRLGLLLALGALLALALQIVQLWVPGRVAALNDVIANVAGMLLGVAIAVPAHRLIPALAHHSAGKGAGNGAANAIPRALLPAALMLLWLGYQWFPLVPTLDLQNMVNAVKPLLRAPRIDAVRALHLALAWLAFCMLWDLSTSGRVRAWTMAVAACAIVGAKLFITGGSVSPANAIGLALALACLPWRHHRFALPALTMAMVVSLFASGLTPFTPLAQAQPFHWVPFSGMLEGSMGVNLLNLLEKCFFYGALIVLISARGGQPLAAASLVALCLGLIEAAQMFLPQRTAESTDPVLALLLGLVAWLARPQAPPRRVRA